MGTINTMKALYLMLICSLCIWLAGCGSSDSESSGLDQIASQDLYHIEIHPTGSSIAHGFDATLEEVLHLISDHGYATAYPSVFGTSKGSTLASYMDIARGGQFDTVPPAYPSSSWYHYTDVTCTYDCQITEYFYWGLTTLLGAQNYTDGTTSRASQISDEWECSTSQNFQNKDPNLYTLLTNPNYSLPTSIPDGNYPTANMSTYFTISPTFPDSHQVFSPYFSSYLSPFGVHVLATSRVSQSKLLHAVYVLAEYLDNNEDGQADDPTVIAKLVESNATLLITYDETESESIWAQLD